MITTDQDLCVCEHPRYEHEDGLYMCESVTGSGMCSCLVFEAAN